MTADRILALDPATKTGWCHSNGQYGLWDLAGPSGEHVGLRLIRLEESIMRAQESWGVDLLVFERASFGSVHLATRQFHDQIRGVILLAAAKIGARWEDFSPATIKLFATGSGRAKKPEMIRACERLLGIDETDDNIADAIWICELAKHRQKNPLVAKSGSTGGRARVVPRKKKPRLFQ